METYFPQTQGDVNSTVEFTHTPGVMKWPQFGESEQSSTAVDCENRSGPDLAHVQLTGGESGLNTLCSLFLPGVSAYPSLGKWRSDKSK